MYKKIIIVSLFLIVTLVSITTLSAGCSSKDNLFTCSEKGDVQNVQRMLKEGDNVNATNKDGITPLWIALQNGHEETANLLLAANADVNATNKDGNTQLWVASRKAITKQ